MSGRRAKQRRRLVWMAASGDEWAMQWCAARMTQRGFNRTVKRHSATESSRSIRRGKAMAP